MDNEIKYTSDGTYSVFAGKTLIAKSFLSTGGNGRVYDVRILQGMNRAATIAKICIDCPEFAASNEIDSSYYPYTFKN